MLGAPLWCRAGKEPMNAMKSPCTGREATWCPIHGDCRCGPAINDPETRSLDDSNCQLHSWESAHAEMGSLDSELGTLFAWVERIDQLSVNGCPWGCDGVDEPPCEIHRLRYAIAQNS